MLEHNESDIQISRLAPMRVNVNRTYSVDLILTDEGLVVDVWAYKGDGTETLGSTYVFEQDVIDSREEEKEGGVIRNDDGSPTATLCMACGAIFAPGEAHDCPVEKTEEARRALEAALVTSKGRLLQTGEIHRYEDLVREKYITITCVSTEVVLGSQELRGRYELELTDKGRELRGDDPSYFCDVCAHFHYDCSDDMACSCCFDSSRKP